jgi:hypothetical protein
MGKEGIINIWLTRDDSNRVLIVTMDLDLGADERSERAFSLRVQKPQRAWFAVEL